MKQDQFEILLAWTMLAANKGAVIERQNILGRDLTVDEYKECYVQNQQYAVLIRDQLVAAREKTGK